MVITFIKIFGPVIGKSLDCEQERSNPEDCYAVSVKKDGTIVGMFLMKNHEYYGISSNKMEL